jgi:hypothetical protein
MSAFNEKLEAFTLAACELLDAWEAADHTGDFYAEGYPFGKSFNEVVGDILHWREIQND